MARIIKALPALEGCEPVLRLGRMPTCVWLKIHGPRGPHILLLCLFCFCFCQIGGWGYPSCFWSRRRFACLEVSQPDTQSNYLEIKPGDEAWSKLLLDGESENKRRVRRCVVGEPSACAGRAISLRGDPGPVANLEITPPMSIREGVGLSVLRNLSHSQRGEEAALRGRVAFAERRAEKEKAEAVIGLHLAFFPRYSFLQGDACFQDSFYPTLVLDCPSWQITVHTEVGQIFNWRPFGGHHLGGNSRPPTTRQMIHVLRTLRIGSEQQARRGPTGRHRQRTERLSD